MSNRYETQPIFMNTEMGLKRIIGPIQNSNSGGFTLNDLADLKTNNYSDLSFINLLKENFQKTDTNTDGKISQDELNKLVSTINQQGLTQEQLYSMINQGTYNSDSQKELIEKIIGNFKKIDTNGDGKVTNGEVDKYLLNKEIDDKKTELNEVKASNYSTFYVDSSKSGETDTDL